MNKAQLILAIAGLAIGAALAILLFFLPVFIATKRKHRNQSAIIALNLCLGWTYLGWVACLIWALAKTEQDGD